MIDSTIIVPSQYGNSVRFTLLNGKIKHIPLDENACLGVGESLDIPKARILTLRKQGRRDIWRIYC